MPRTSISRKARKTFSLSRETVKYLENLRKERKKDSMSAVLEDVVRQLQQAKELERISASVSHYYDTLTDAQMAEDHAWGEFAETQFPTED
ncbi:MAG: hypothetical protein WBQ09_17215 [Terriglobales bacterium]|jgi:hypothetical protein